jgi:Na+-driven multidrug efflux pump
MKAVGMNGDDVELFSSAPVRKAVFALAVPIVASYSNEAIAGMGTAKKIDLMAFALAQGMTQGTLPLIGYNYVTGNRERMNNTIRTTLIACLITASGGAVYPYTCAVPITS